MRLAGRGTLQARVDLPAPDLKGVPLHSREWDLRALRSGCAGLESQVSFFPSVQADHHAQDGHQAVPGAAQGATRTLSVPPLVRVQPLRCATIVDRLRTAAWRPVARTSPTSVCSAAPAPTAAVRSAAAARLGDGAFASLISDGVIAGVGSVIIFLPQILILFTFIILLEDSGYLARAAYLMDRAMRSVGLSGTWSRCGSAPVPRTTW